MRMNERVGERDGDADTRGKCAAGEVAKTWQQAATAEGGGCDERGVLSGRRQQLRVTVIC